jgi:retron-type reverse transcriptase
MQIIGLPDDLITLADKWLVTRYFYVNVNGNNSFIKFSKFGTVQGSILGTILCAIYVSPIFDLKKMTKFANVNHIV